MIRILTLVDYFFVFLSAALCANAVSPEDRESFHYGSLFALVWIPRGLGAVQELLCLGREKTEWVAARSPLLLSRASFLQTVS